VIGNVFEEEAKESSFGVGFLLQDTLLKKKEKYSREEGYSAHGKHGKPEGKRRERKKDKKEYSSEEKRPISSSFPSQEKREEFLQEIQRLFFLFKKEHLPHPLRTG